MNLARVLLQSMLAETWVPAPPEDAGDASSAPPSFNAAAPEYNVRLIMVHALTWAPATLMQAVSKDWAKIVASGALCVCWGGGANCCA